MKPLRPAPLRSPSWAGALCALALLAAPAIHAADIVVTGSWFETVDQADLAAGAGSDFRSPIESAANVATLDVTNTGGASWTVQLARSDASWPSAVAVAALRTSDGSGSGTIGGGTAYVTASGAPQTFFTGSGDRSGIQIRLKTSGLSVRSVGPGTYSTTLTYSVVSN